MQKDASPIVIPHPPENKDNSKLATNVVQLRTPKINPTIRIPVSSVKPDILSTQCENSPSCTPDKERFTQVWTAAESMMKSKHTVSPLFKCQVGIYI